MNTYHTLAEVDYVGCRDPRVLWTTYGLPADLRGKSVLDIGTWDGGFSLVACERGAQSVVALDKFWTPDRPIGPIIESIQHVKVVTKAPFVIKAHDITWPLAETYDLVLFLQVFYHMLNPVAGFINASNCTKLRGLLFVETLVNTRSTIPALYWIGREKSTDFWQPSVALIECLCKANGMTCEKTWQVDNRICWRCERVAPLRYACESLLTLDNARDGLEYYV